MSRKRRRNPRGVDMRVIPNDPSPELASGFLVIPVSKAAKTFLSWLYEPLNLKEAVNISGGRETTIYWAEWGHLREFKKAMKAIKPVGWNIQYEE